MPTETAQMISFHYHHEELWGKPVPELLMKFSEKHDKHPCTLWMRESLSNFLFACKLGIELVKEYRFRYDSTKHQRALDIFHYGLEHPPLIEDLGLTEFAKAMPDEFQVDCPVESYRNYYREDKKHLHNWKKRNKPTWI
jgi:hypothetical protein